MLHIYGSPLSFPSNKVLFTANYLGISYEFHRVNLGAGEHKHPDFLKINPFGKVPAIVDDGFNLSESNAIIRYLADQKSSALYPKEIKQRAVIDQWIDFSSQHIGPAVGKIMFNTHWYKFSGVEKDERSLKEGGQFLEQYLPMVEKQLSQQKYLAGNQMSLADIVLLASLDPCEICKVDLTHYAKITAWRNELMKQSFYRDCFESYTAMFNKLMSEMAK